MYIYAHANLAKRNAHIQQMHCMEPRSMTKGVLLLNSPETLTWLPCQLWPH